VERDPKHVNINLISMQPVSSAVMVSLVLAAPEMSLLIRAQGMASISASNGDRHPRTLGVELAVSSPFLKRAVRQHFRRRK